MDQVGPGVIWIFILLGAVGLAGWSIDMVEKVIRDTYGKGRHDKNK
jgi:hypothetical protein